MSLAGENLLAVVKAISNSSLLSDPGEFRHGRLVFFDVLGHTMIVYPARMGIIINTMTCFLVFLRLVCQIFGHGPGMIRMLNLISCFHLISCLFEKHCSVKLCGPKIFFIHNLWVVELTSFKIPISRCHVSYDSYIFDL